MATELLEQRWDHIFFTGSTKIGRVVAEAAAKHLTPVTLELGGKSPAIVDRSANLEVAGRRIAWGKFLNAGQTCIAPDYVLVDETVQDELIEHIRTAVSAFYGEDPMASADYARIVNGRHFDRLSGLLEGGGEAVIGGTTDADERYISPTVLVDTPADARDHGGGDLRAAAAGAPGGVGGRGHRPGERPTQAAGAVRLRR